MLIFTKTPLFNQKGFAYLAVLFLIVAISISLAVVSQDAATLQMREKERDWLFVGQQYQQAIKSYYQHGPDGIQILPKNIDDLLLDSRFITPVRHLRKAYLDPLTGKDWTLIYNAEGYLIGVYSESPLPILLQQLTAQIIDTPNQASLHSDIKFIANIEAEGSDKSKAQQDNDEADSVESDTVEPDAVEKAVPI